MPLRLSIFENKVISGECKSIHRVVTGWFEVEKFIEFIVHIDISSVFTILF